MEINGLAVAGTIAMILLLGLIFKGMVTRREADIRLMRRKSAFASLCPAVPADPFLAVMAQIPGEAARHYERQFELFKRELGARFDEHMPRKKHVSAYVEDSGLDRALLSVWDQIQHYPSLAKRVDFDTWNTMSVSEISGQDIDGYETVSFIWEDVRYSFRSRPAAGFDGTFYRDIAIAEEAVERLALTATVENEPYVSFYGHVSINAFQKEGHWPTMLLKWQAATTLASDKKRFDSYQI